MIEKSIRVLLVEDSDDDVFLIISQLKRGGYAPEVKVVRTLPEFQDALKYKWDLILCDFTLQDFDGLQALKVYREAGIDIPFIVVSGRIDEETAVKAMRWGAHDYVMKDRMVRLLPVIEREMREARVRAEKKIEAEKFISQAKQDWENIFQSIGHPTIVLNPEFRITAANREAVLLAGETLSPLLGKLCYEVFHRSTHPPENCPVRRYFALGDVEETKIRTPTGVYLLKITPIVKDGKVHSFIHVATDMTRREQAEKMQALLFEAIGQCEEGVCITDCDARILYVNNYLEKVTGYKKDEVLGQYVGILCNFKEPPIFQELQRVLEKGETWSVRSTSYNKAGMPYEAAVTVSPVFDEEGKVTNYVLVMRDITQTVLAERQIEQAKKLDALATLAGGLAHEFNNILMTIQGHASLMLMGTDKRHPNYERLMSIVNVVQRGATLTAQLVGMAGVGKYELKPVNMNDILKAKLHTFSKERKGIQVFEKYELDPWLVEVDRAQMELVVDCLLNNAVWAMPTGGRLYVETKNVSVDSTLGKSHGVGPGDYFLVTVRDTGIGMDEKTQERIFDPFYSIKNFSQSKGLGLSVVYGVVKAHGGNITVKSKPGEGSTFSIFLPALVDEKMNGRDVAREQSGESKTILVVDDELTVVEVTREMLSGMGYKVITATNGEEAIKIYRESMGKIDLVLLDIIMPGMNGEKVLESLLEIDPRCCVLLTSGYSFDETARKLLNRGARLFLQKPYRFEDLKEKVKMVLAESKH
ncbi:MAG: response regulator [Syntrophales bacterium]|nr:response regulator [Syntrophales bacterium]